MNDESIPKNDFIELGAKGGWTDANAKLRRQVASQNVALVALAGALTCLAVALFYFAVLQQPKHFVIKVDERNRVSFGGYIGDEVTIKEEYIPGELVKFVENWRTVTPDNTLLKRNLNRLHCMMPGDSSAVVAMSEYYRDPKTDPFTRNEQIAVLTEIRSILKLSEQTWSVEWDEITRTHDGIVQGNSVRYKANVLLSTGITAPECRTVNSLGLYIKSIAWTSVL